MLDFILHRNCETWCAGRTNQFVEQSGVVIEKRVVRFKRERSTCFIQLVVVRNGQGGVLLEREMKFLLDSS